MSHEASTDKGEQKRKDKLSLSFRAKRRHLYLRNYIRYKLKRKITGVKIAILVGAALSLLIGLLHGNLLHSRLPVDGTSTIITIGAAIIGVLAILFTLNTLLINNSLDKLPAGLYYLFVTDLRLDLTFAGIASTAIALFVMGISFQAENGSYRYNLYRLVLIVIVWVIVLIYLFYKRVQTVLSPNYQLLHFTRQVKKDIDEITYLAEKYADLSANAKGVTKQEKEIIKASVYVKLRPREKEIIYNLTQLASLHFRHLEKGDKSLAGDCLTAIMASIYGYLITRKDSSVALPTNMLIVSQSDLAKFIEQSVEILEPIWLTYLKNNDLDGIRLFLSSYKGIISTTLQIKPINNPNEHPAFDSAYFPLSRFIDKGIAEKNEDAMFESAKVLAQIAADSAKEKFYISPLQSIFSDLKKLFAAGITLNVTTTTSQTLESYQAITLGILNQKRLNSMELDMVKDEWNTLLKILSAGVGNSTMSDVSMRVFAENLLGIAVGDIENQPTEEQLKRFIEVSGFILEIARTTYSTNNGKTIVGEVFNRPLEVISEAIFEFLGNKDIAKNYRQELDRIFNGIASAMQLIKINDEDNRLLRLNDLIESQTKIGLIACRSKQYEKAAIIFNNLMSIADRLLGNLKTSREAGRTAVKAGYIACALKKEAPSIYSELRDKLRLFEKQYVNKVCPDGIDDGVGYSPSPFAIRGAFDAIVRDWQYMRTGLPGIFDRPEDILLDLKNIESIEAFRNDVWAPESHPRDLIDNMPEKKEPKSV